MKTPKQRFNFSKQERLCSRKVLESVFEMGRSINEKPIRFLWMESTGEEKTLLKIAISVPKKNFKRAVDRNKIKRQIREAYRLNKHKILLALENSEKKFSALLLFTGREMPSYKDLEAKIILTLQRFAKEACKN